MKFTGEFFIPPDIDEHSGNQELQIEHKHRYYSIAALARGKIVLDIASGEGYGSSILAQQAVQVIGVDISPDLVAHAAQKYGGPTLSFQQGSVEKIPLPDHSVDMIVSFETIEHIGREAQSAFLTEIRRVLKPGGLCIISTPDKKNYTDRFDHHNEFHIHEFYKKEFNDFLKNYFAHLTLYDQGFEVASLILNKETYEHGLSLSEFHIDGNAYHFEGKYLIALCSDDLEQSRQPVASLIPESTRSYFQLIDDILRLEKEILTLGAWGRASSEEVEKERRKIADLLGQFAGLQDQHSGLQNQYHELQERYANVQLRYEQSDATNQGLQHQLEEIAERIQKLITENKQLKEQLSEKTDELKIETERREIESNRIYRLETEKKELEAKLQDIFSSDGYRLLRIYYRLKSKVFPANSERLRKLKKIGGSLKSLKLFSKRSDDTTAGGGSQAAATEGPYIPQVPAGIHFPLAFPVFEQPLVSILIPAYNNWAFTRNCLISIYRFTEGISYEIIVGDNVSTDETIDLEKYFTNIKYLRNKENLGYIKNINNAASHARGRFILTLNNDTTVTPNWLSSMIAVMNRDEKAGLVGSKLVFPDGTLQEAGGIIWKDASGWNYGRGGNPEAPEFNYLKEVDYISGASNLIRKDLWDQLKGLDERYVPAYFDDSDLAFAIRHLGYKTIYQPASVVVHYEGLTHGTNTDSGTKKYQIVNAGKFVEKWGGELEKEHFPNAKHVFYARDRSRHKKTIVVIDHYVPHFDMDAGSRTTYQLLQLFVNLDYNVKFIGDNFYRHEPYTTYLQQMGIEVLYGEYYKDNWVKWIEENKTYIDFFYINRPHIAIKYITLLKERTEAKVVYYGHDLHFIRERLQYEIEKDPALLASAREWEKMETELIRASDTILTLSISEKEIIEKEIGHSDIRIIPPFFYSRFNAPVNQFDQRDGLLFIGGFQHKPNVDAVIWFVNEVYPLIVKTLGKIRFIIAGSKPPPEITRLASSHIEVKGYVPDEELNELYRNSKLAIIPLRYGAGVKGKTVETIYHGLPFVTTRFGIEGLKDIRELTDNQDDASGFALRVTELYGDDDKLRAFSRKEIEYAKTHFSEDNAKKLIVQIFS